MSINDKKTEYFQLRTENEGALPDVEYEYYKRALEGSLPSAPIRIEDVIGLEDALDDIPTNADELPAGDINKYVTQAEKDKLASLESSKWKGEYTSLAELEAAYPTADAGSYANVDVPGETVVRYIWDSNDQEWVASGTAGSMTPAQVKEAYESNPDTNAYTDAEKAKLATVQSGATANQTDAFLRDRQNHLGTQAISTVDGLQTALNAKAADSAVVKLTGVQTVVGVKIFGASPTVPTPIAPTQAANKEYIDTALDDLASDVFDLIDTKADVDAVVKLTGDQTVAGIKTFETLRRNSPVIVPTDVATKGYTDGAFVGLGGNQTITGVKTFTSSPVGPDPIEDQDFATKKYVDDNSGGGDVSGRQVGEIFYAANRAVMPLGALAMDGTEHDQAAYPDLYQFILDGGLGLVTEVDWQADPLNRGKAVAESSTGKFRIPDYNGVQANSFAVFGRGDGGTGSGDVLQDQMQRITGNVITSYAVVRVVPGGGALKNSTMTGGTSMSSNSFLASDSSGSIDFDSGNSPGARVGAETFPTHVKVVWCVHAFSEGYNPGQLDVQALADAYENINTNFVGVAGDQTVDGVKTFISSPVVPTPTLDNQAATKKYVDDNSGSSIPTGAATNFLGWSTPTVPISVAFSLNSMGFTSIASPGSGQVRIPCGDNSGNGRTYLIASNSDTSTSWRLVARAASGQILVPLTPTANAHATSKQYVDTKMPNARAVAIALLDPNTATTKDIVNALQAV